MLENILTFINIVGAIFLIREGTFIKTKYFKYSSFFISLCLIGILLKITHWGFGNELITISSILILTFYTKHFSEKPLKYRIDYLKLSWGIMAILIYISTIYHLFSRELRIIPPLIMFFIVLEYFRTEKELKK